MAKLIYATPTSLDGYIAADNYDWGRTDDAGFAFINDVQRPIGTYLYGRKTYQTMAIWETPDVITGRTPAMLDFARIWQAADKIVYSRSLETVLTSKTRLAREFDPAAVRDLKAQLPHDVSVGGPTSPPKRSEAGSSTRFSCSSCPWRLAAATMSCPATSASSWISWTSAVLRTAWSTCAITRRPDGRP
jgi:dihydrofolate reductase